MNGGRPCAEGFGSGTVDSRGRAQPGRSSAANPGAATAGKESARGNRSAHGRARRARVPGKRSSSRVVRRAAAARMLGEREIGPARKPAAESAAGAGFAFAATPPTSAASRSGPCPRKTGRLPLIRQPRGLGSRVGPGVPPGTRRSFPHFVERPLEDGLDRWSRSKSTRVSLEEIGSEVFAFGHRIARVGALGRGQRAGGGPVRVSQRVAPCRGAGHRGCRFANRSRQRTACRSPRKTGPRILGGSKEGRKT